MAFSPDSQRVVTSSDDMLAKVWEVVAEDLNPLIAAIEPLAASSRPEDQ